MKNQKGFAAVEIILIIVLISALGYAGYYVYSQRDKKVETPQSTIGLDESGSETVTEKKTGGYSIDLSGSLRPTKTEVAYEEFVVGKYGEGTAYDQTSKSFKTGTFTTDGKKLDVAYPQQDTQPVAQASDGTNIYLSQWGDADSYGDTYFIDLKNGKVLQVAFGYTNYDDGVKAPNYMTMDEVTAQRVKDLAAVKTFKFE